MRVGWRSPAERGPSREQECHRSRARPELRRAWICDSCGESVGNACPRGDFRRIRRQRGQASVLHGSADGKVVQGLVLPVVEAEEIVNWVVEKAADPGAPDTSSLGFKIENLTDHSGLPKKPSVDPGAMGL